MSEKNEKDPTPEKKRLKLTKEVIESLTDEDLDKAAGGDDVGFIGAIPPRIEDPSNPP
jgi:hypothetical protein